MKNLGIKATPEEIEECMKLAKEASETPMIALASDDALHGRDWSTMAWERAKKKCHELALKHGLPEIEGYYGMTNDGEFVSE